MSSPKGDDKKDKSASAISIIYYASTDFKKCSNHYKISTTVILSVTLDLISMCILQINHLG
jgi:hypothetical protein